MENVGLVGSSTFRPLWPNNSPTPIAVPGLRGVLEIAAGVAHTCARLTDGTARCWGYNISGMLADGTTTERRTPVDAALLARMQRELAKREAENRLATYRPYTKQRAFHAAGAQYRERLLIAANQVGKTIAGGAEMAMHLTGLYPDWWEGRRFDRAIKAWAASVTNDATRDNVQAKLIGPPETERLWGTGFIPVDRLISTKPGMGTPNLLDNAVVRHVSGGISTVGFKAYSQGRTKWQGPKKDWLWFDEEPPLDIYTEGLTRLNAVVDAIAWMTFTPLKGMSDVVMRFPIEDQ